VYNLHINNVVNINIHDAGDQNNQQPISSAVAAAVSDVSAILAATLASLCIIMHYYALFCIILHYFAAVL